MPEFLTLPNGWRHASSSGRYLGSRIFRTEMMPSSRKLREANPSPVGQPFVSEPVLKWKAAKYRPRQRRRTFAGSYCTVSYSSTDLRSHGPPPSYSPSAPPSPSGPLGGTAFWPDRG
ncbi:unnamed protein product [Calypogeia fissa]